LMVGFTHPTWLAGWSAAEPRPVQRLVGRSCR